MKVAVFYDLENLFQGYQNLYNIDIHSILCTIKGKIKLVNNENTIIDIQQWGYANWCNLELNVLLKKLSFNNIAPVQLVDMGLGTTNNNADIHIVTDIVSLTYTQPNIDTYILVTGDAGFLLVKDHLTAQGKQLWCAGQTSKISTLLMDNCDLFIPLHKKDSTCTKHL